MSTAKPMPLDRGGESWKGWRLGPYGRAREWRLFTPAGETFTAGDLQQLRGLILDVDYLRGRVHALQGQVEAHACHFSPDDVASLRVAIAILGLALPTVQPRAWRGVTGPRPSGRAVSAISSGDRSRDPRCDG